jgi:toxin ParE1/3/4
MTRRWRLTPRAEISLVRILDWTAERFGPKQALIYRNLLLDRCAAVADERAAGRDCSSISPTAAGLRYVRAGQHFLLFEEENGALRFVDIVHARADLPTRLARLTGDACDPEETPP